MKLLNSLYRCAVLALFTLLKGRSLPNKDQIMARREALKKEGMVPNPLLRYPRNIHCYCGSFTKAKECCLPKAKRFVHFTQAEQLAKYIQHVENPHLPIEVTK